MESLVVLSDVHLGSDLGVPEALPPARSAAIDDDLCRLIDHYRTSRPSGSRWRLVIAGDFIDFVGMTLPTNAPGTETEPNEEELMHGLGNAEDHAVAKMRAVAVRHADVFAALGRFVATGHALTFIRGNHDAELHWDLVREELLATVVGHARTWSEEQALSGAALSGAQPAALSGAATAALSGEAPAAFDAAAIAARIEDAPWFLDVAGVAYIEHGHQYDPFCSVDHVLSPRRARDPRRTAWGFVDVLLRFVVRRTPGVPEYGHETMGVTDYLRMAAGLGPSGMWLLLVRFVRAIRELFRLRTEYATDAARGLATEHELLLTKFAIARRMGREKLLALRDLQVAPITRTVRGILASLLLDQLAVGAIGIVLLAVFGVLSLFYPGFLWGDGAVIAAWVGVFFLLRHLRKIDPDIELGLRAGALARIFSAPFVVMGHTHVPRRQPIAGGATYVNLGSWSECVGQTATRTHLVIDGELGALRAELRSWCSIRGPLRFS